MHNSGDGSTVASISDCTIVDVWDTETGAHVYVGSHVGSHVYSSRGDTDDVGCEETEVVQFAHDDGRLVVAAVSFAAFSFAVF